MPVQEGELRPAAVLPETSRLAAALPQALRMGTSSWSFPGWQGLVYEGQALDETRLARKGLAAYASHPLLRAVGVDRSFYAPVPLATLQRWHAEVPADFRFILKAHAALTTPRSASRPAFLRGVPDVFLDPEHARKHVIGPAQQALGDKLGVIVFQFSPLGARVWRHRQQLLERLEAFLAALPVGQYAFEWRDPDIFGQDYAELLAHHGAVHGFAAHPRLPSLSEQASWFELPRTEGRADLSSAAPLVIRWLLARELGYEEAKARFAPFNVLCQPDDDTRQEVATLVRGALAQGREAMVIINNKAEGSAPLSVARLAAALG